MIPALATASIAFELAGMLPSDDWRNNTTEDWGNYTMMGWHRIIKLPMLNRRKSRRRKMVLPVKVSVDKVTYMAYTVDITTTGAQLGGLRTPLQPGMIISLQRGSTKAEFRVRCIRQLGPNELRAGIESVEPQDNFWGVDLSDELEAEVRYVNFSV